MPRTVNNRIAQALILVFSLFFLANLPAEPPRYIRVAIMQDASTLSLKTKGFFEITDSSEKKILFQGKNLKATVTAYKNGMLIGAKGFSSNKVIIRTRQQDLIFIDGRAFRGKIQLIKNSNARFTAVNYIELEDYVKGILFHEVSHYWPVEALSAQAVVSRTYAIYQSMENKNKDFDLTSDVFSQVYGGRASERYRTNNAVEETKGIVLNYRGKVMPAYFHATCGGHTEDVSLVWNLDMAPLKGVVCGFCQESPHFSWHYVIDAKELEGKLSKSGYNISGINKIAVLGRDGSGRISDLSIVSEKKALKISAKDFRGIIGPNLIRSTNFNAGIIGADIVFEGFGWGHGVGLCQWGAYFMAKQGYTFERILKYYYPGSEISPK